MKTIKHKQIIRKEDMSGPMRNAIEQQAKGFTYIELITYERKIKNGKRYGQEIIAYYNTLEEKH